MSELTHLGEDGQPRMVDVSAKFITVRTARAQAVVTLPAEVVEVLNEGEIQTRKGPVFQTAILAGTMAAKKASDLIPLCHPIGLDACDIEVVPEGTRVVILATCRVAHKTGVEMEALTAASVAALTIYDMCKGLSPRIEIGEIKLLEKTGGKKDYRA